MKQQPAEQRNRDNKIKNNWSVEPAVAANGKTPLVALRLGGGFETFIHKGLAIRLANALVDCAEEDKTTNNHHETQGMNP